MSETIHKWRKAKIRFLTEQHHNLIDYGNSTRGCDTIHPGDVREVYFEWWDRGVEGCKPGTRIVYVEWHDMIPMRDEDFEMIELGTPEEFHPVELLLKEINHLSEKLVENIQNVII